MAGLLALVVILLALPALAAGKVVRYHGYRLAVPAGWPVYDLAKEPSRCVRFDVHAVYLGTPSAAQQCPAHAIGASEAILIEPAPAAGARSTTPTSFSMRVHRLLITASWSRHPRLIARALGLRALPRARSLPAAHASAARPRVRPARSGRAASVFTGLGFDVCSAPSSSAMSAWLGSPYRAVGIYIGGANRACSQPNLTTAWVHQQSAAGWRLIPTYVGLQAPGAGCGCASILAGHASAEGAAAAQDAVAQAQALGIGAGNPIYDDMEAYSHTSANTSLVLQFLSAWTSTLHSLGYVSGVYSSTNSGIADLVDARGTSFAEPDDIWIADWNGAQTTSDAAVPAGAWSPHRRLHQYQGDHRATYGGVTLSIDSNYLDGSTAGAGYTALFPDGTFVQVAGQPEVYRIAGGAPLLVTDWSTVGGPQPVTSITEAQLYTLPPVPVDGTFLGTEAGAFYRVAGGAALPVSDWSIYGGVQPYVTIDPYDVQNPADPASHLYAHPLDGTVVQGLPSGTYWSFSRGRRVPVAPRSSAVAVSDASLAVYPIVNCVVPRLRHKTLAQAKLALQNAHCTLGKVLRPRRVRRGHVLLVVAQSPHAGRKHVAGWKVRVRLR